jgi:hypothetical protein
MCIQIMRDEYTEYTSKEQVTLYYEDDCVVIEHNPSGLVTQGENVFGALLMLADLLRSFTGDADELDKHVECVSDISEDEVSDSAMIELAESIFETTELPDELKDDEANS